MARAWFTPSRILMRLRRIARNDQLILAFLAVFVGGLAGGAVILFREAIAFIQMVAFGSGTPRLSEHIQTLPGWWVLAAPTVGGLVVGLLFRFLLRRDRTSGVADAIAASALRGGRMSISRGLRTALVDALSIGVGASVGREGPAVHLGASLGAWIAGLLHLTRTLSRTLLGCGVAAAVAASFNAPIAGALFAHEVIVGHYGLSAFAPIVIASVVGTMATHAYFGPFPAFLVPEYAVASFWEIPLCVFLGIAAALAAIAFVRGCDLAGFVGHRVVPWRWLRPAVGGLIVGSMALFVPQIIGLGYGATELALFAAFPLSVLLLIFAAKLVATTVSFGFGFAGGVFSPSLVMGAMLGGAFGAVLQLVFPAEVMSGTGAYAVVGMAAVTAAVLGAPLSTTLIVFEMTGNYPLTLAVMVAVVTATTVTRQTLGHSYFTWQLKRRGLDLKGGLETSLLRAIRVREVMNPDCERIDPGTRLPSIRARLQTSTIGELFVVRGDGRLIGTVTLADLSETAFDLAVDNLIAASDVARPHPPTLLPGETLDAALRLMRLTGEGHIAVVDGAESQRLIGCLHERDVMAAYNRALVEGRHQSHD